MKRFSYLLPFILCASTLPVSVEFREKKISPRETEIACTFVLQPHEVLYQKNILFSVDSPDVTLSTATANKDLCSSYDPHLKEHCMVFDENVTFSFKANYTAPTAPEHAMITVMYATNTQKEGKTSTFPLTFAKPHEIKEAHIANAEVAECKAMVKQEEVGSWRSIIQNIKDTVTSTNSWLLRFVFVFLLGLLLSLTPCIYPMIPITVGILQAQGSASISRNFFLSACYTLGLSTTFALMGLLAASSGSVFGHMLANPIFVLCVVALLCYFAFSLFGFYNMYIPSFMRKKGSLSNSGSAVSIFTFGLASGTFASPCVSPGLALVLAIVAALGSKFLGFLLLFVFGIGMSTPLLLIGTFSGSMNMLPRAGMWMIEIQRIFGFLLLGMCFYYLNTILPEYITSFGLAVLLVVAGLYYLNNKNSAQGFWKLIKNLIGIGCLASAVFVSVVTIQDLYYPELAHANEASWFTDLEQAQTTALQRNKKLLIDFWTPYCSICKAITNTVLKDASIKCILDKYYAVLTVDASDNDLEPYKTLRSRYDIQGVPTIIIVDPTTNSALKRWSSELYDMEKSAVIEELTSYGQAKSL